MRDRNTLVAFLFVLLLSSLILQVPNAAIGEFAGHVRFNVSLGSSETLQMTIFNSGNQTIYFQVQKPHLAISTNSLENTANATTPIVTVTPMNGSLAPQENLPLNITVYVPTKHNVPGMAWSGIVSAFEVSNAGSSGASVQTGVGKIITIVAYPQKGLSYEQIVEIIAAIAVVAIISGVSYYMLKVRKKAKGKAKISPEILPFARSNAPAKKGARPRTKSAKTTRRRKAATSKRRAPAKRRTKRSGARGARARRR